MGIGQYAASDSSSRYATLRHSMLTRSRLLAMDKVTEDREGPVAWWLMGFADSITADIKIIACVKVLWHVDSYGRDSRCRSW